MSEQIYQTEINFLEHRSFDALNSLKNHLVESTKKMSLITLNFDDIESLTGAEWQFVLVLNEHCDKNRLILQINPITSSLHKEAKLFGFHTHLSLEEK